MPNYDNPLDKYHISDYKTDSSDSNITYWGYIDKEGNWYIQRQNMTTGEYRYTQGTKDYIAEYGRRESLTYAYFNELQW